MTTAGQGFSPVPTNPTTNHLAKIVQIGPRVASFTVQG
jgi:hypothetical protein